MDFHKKHVFIYMIVYAWLVLIFHMCYNHVEGGVVTVNIFGIEISVEILTVIISGIFLLASVWLSYFLGSRKQYKDIIKRLGNFEKETLESMIGNTGDKGNLTLQHSNLVSQHIALQKQHAELNKQLTQLNMEAALEKERWERLLNENKFEPQKVIDQIVAMSEKINTLQAANNKLSRNLNSLLNKNKGQDINQHEDIDEMESDYYQQ